MADKTEGADDAPEPTTSDLAKILNLAAPAAKKPAADKSAKAAPAAETKPKPGDADYDPDFDDDAELSEEEKAAKAKKTKAAGKAEEAGDDDTRSEEEKAAAALAAEAEEPAAGKAEDEDAEAAAKKLELDEEDAATRKSFTAEQQKAFDKAMHKKAGKLAAANKTINEQKAAMEELLKVPAAAAVPTAANPLADVADDASLAQREQEQRALRRWALTHPNGGTIKGPKGEDIEITAEKALEIQADTEEMLNQHIPARRNFLADRGTQEATAVQEYPWLKNQTSQGAVQVEAMLRRYPALRNVPEIKLWLADSLMGRQTREAKKTAAATAAKSKATTVVERAPASPAGGRAPARVTGAVKAANMKTVIETGRDPGNAGLASLIGRKG